jgi:hypothetical protein
LQETEDIFLSSLKQELGLGWAIKFSLSPQHNGNLRNLR